MIESTGTFLEYEVAYRAERLRGLTSPRRAEHAAPADGRLTRRAQRRRAPRTLR